MSKFKLSTIHYTLIGTIIGMILVFGAFVIFKHRLIPKDVPEIHTKNVVSSDDGEKCPVCKKPVNSASDYYEIIAGKRFNFCGTICHKSFKDQPQLYLKDMKVNIDIQIIRDDESGDSSSPSTQEPSGEEIQDSSGEQNSDSTPDESDINTTSPPQDSSSTDNIPMPDEIPLNSGGGSEIEEIPLDSGDNPQTTLPPNPQNQGGGSSDIEELMLDVPGQNTNPAPAAPPKSPAKTPSSSGKSNDMVIEEIPLN